MKSLLDKIRTPLLAVFLSTLMTTSVTLAQPAGVSTSYVDSSTSNARLFLGSSNYGNPVNVAVARVQGTVKLDAAEPGRSQVDLAIYPASEDWGAGLNSQADLASGYVPDATDHTLLVFQSKQVSQAADGSFRVRGLLSLTRVERSIQADPNEAYSGAVYGDPVLQTTSREAEFVFPNADATGTANEVTASARIVHEDFGELSTTIEQTNWPNVFANQVCETPSTVGQDYSGMSCSGREIAMVSQDNCQAPSVGQDSDGLVCGAPSGDVATIALDLKLTSDRKASAGMPLSGDSTGQ
jgi:polyisoprenoid-binding protein YceI